MVDPWRPHGILDEIERGPDGSPQSSRTIFLAGSECPFTCVFCDLWQYTTDDPTPVGATPRQIEVAMEDLERGTIDILKLYNASNFFDSRAVPEVDYQAIADLASPFHKVVVECHPKLVDTRCLHFRDMLVGSLEIALGLETVCPEALSALNKQVTVEDFARAASFALGHGIAIRAFVLIGAPYIKAEEGLEWLERSIRYAIEQGAGQVAIIPLRSGNGALEELAASGDFRAPGLQDIETAFTAGLAAQTETSSVSLDLWDIESLDAPTCCVEARLQRLRLMNAAGKALPAVECVECGGGA
jgi:radical SAM enzyme (TIGR01210 family)